MARRRDNTPGPSQIALAKDAIARQTYTGLDFATPGRVRIMTPGLEDVGMGFPHIPDQIDAEPLDVTHDPYGNFYPTDTQSQASATVPTEPGLLHRVHSRLFWGGQRQGRADQQHLEVEPDFAIRGTTPGLHLPGAKLVVGEDAQRYVDQYERVRTHPREGHGGAVAYTNPDQFWEHASAILDHGAQGVPDDRLERNRQVLKDSMPFFGDPVLSVGVDDFTPDEEADGRVFWNRHTGDFDAAPRYEEDDD